MEFSFDRSRNQAGTQTPPNSESTRPQPSGIKPGPDLNSQDPSTIANERLRKAIERNRAKQVARETQAPTSNPASAQPEARFSQMNGAFQNQSQTQFQTPPKAPPEAPPLPPQQEFFSSRTVEPEVESVVTARKPRASVASTKPPTVVSRRSVAKPDNTEFVPVKRTQRKVASQVNYSTSSTSTTRKKTKPMSPALHNWISKACWVFCVIMVGRLIFADGGVTDFYSQKSTVNAKETELERIKKDNSVLMKEIERMKSDSGYQKKLVRDHLGFIAKDEYLVLFPKEK